ncbi:cytochrome b5-like heme/steroid binding domain-containing protein [Mycena rosella]|uniref:Cytochrome b5-like heme/steroid binding domain-containing protein n=1 Tax=Mycena rosella TaxID=1033263 RepID=A0AAD7CGY6_MYCRO|nr:cytochrome b5-like heme/steroid binding domain-containing protein [Mycena rosella]
MSSLWSPSLLQYVTSLLLLFPAVYLARRYIRAPSSTLPIPAGPAERDAEADDKPVKSIMQPARTDLAPPKDDPFTLAQLAPFDGSDPSKPIYVSIKGTVFDVSAKADVYGAGCSYNVFAGKDGSKGLGMSSLVPENAVPDYSALNEADRKVLDDWHSFFSKRYNIVGRVVDHPIKEESPADATSSNL